MNSEQWCCHFFVKNVPIMAVGTYFFVACLNQLDKTIDNSSPWRSETMHLFFHFDLELTLLALINEVDAI
jgi:hypothetical protein